MIDLDLHEHNSFCQVLAEGDAGRPVDRSIGLSTAVRLEAAGLIALEHIGAGAIAYVTPAGLAFAYRGVS